MVANAAASRIAEHTSATRLVSSVFVTKSSHANFQNVSRFNLWKLRKKKTVAI